MIDKCKCSGMALCSYHSQEKRKNHEFQLMIEKKQQFQQFINKKQPRNIQCKGSFNKMKKVK